MAMRGGSWPPDEVAEVVVDVFRSLISLITYVPIYLPSQQSFIRSQCHLLSHCNCYANWFTSQHPTCLVQMSVVRPSCQLPSRRKRRETNISPSSPSYPNRCQELRSDVMSRGAESRLHSKSRIECGVRGRMRVLKEKKQRWDNISPLSHHTESPRAGLLSQVISNHGLCYAIDDVQLQFRPLKARLSHLPRPL